MNIVCKFLLNCCVNKIDYDIKEEEIVGELVKRNEKYEELNERINEKYCMYLSIRL